MIILAILLSLVGIAALCWLLFNLAVFALPFFAGVTIGIWAHTTGAGIPGAIIMGAIAAAVTFGLFQLLLLVARPTWIKLLVILAFVAPAAVAGYYATLGIVKLTMPSDTWQMVFAIVGAIAVGITAFMRLTMMARPDQPGRALREPRDRSTSPRPDEAEAVATSVRVGRWKIEPVKLGS